MIEDGYGPLDSEDDQIDYTGTHQDTEEDDDEGDNLSEVQ